MQNPLAMDLLRGLLIWKDLRSIPVHQHLSYIFIAEMTKSTHNKELRSFDHLPDNIVAAESVYACSTILKSLEKI